MKSTNENSKKSIDNSEIDVSETTSKQIAEKKEPNALQENIVKNRGSLMINFINTLRAEISKLEPTLNIESDEDLFEATLQKIIEDHSTCIKLSEQNRAIAKTIEANPRLLIFIEELMKGTSARVALVKSDLVNVDPDEDDDQYEDYNLAVSQTRERRDKIRKQTELRLSKCKRCGEVAQEFYHQAELSDDQIDDFVNFLERAIETIFEANIDRDFIETMWKAYNYDKEIQNAKKQGLIEGKNETIAIRRASQTDGLSSFSSAGTKPESAAKQGYIERLLHERYS